MVIFWNFAGVPFVCFSSRFSSPIFIYTIPCSQTYVYSVVYMASHNPSKYRFSTPTYVALYVTLLTAYYMSVSFDSPIPCSNRIIRWDTSMSQKSRFKMQTQGINTFRKAFPQLPWGTIKNPEFIQTQHGFVSILAFY